MPWLSGIIASCIISNVVLASVLALAAWLVQRSLGRPGIARVLWVLVLVKLVTPPLVSMPVHKSPGIVACALGTCGCQQHVHRQTILRDTLPWVLLAAWSTGAGATGWVAWRRWTRFRRLIAHAVPAPPEWQLLAEQLSGELGLQSAPKILAVPGRLPPLVVPSLRRPRMLIPMALMDQLSGPQRVALLLHELVHIKRRDHLVRLLELAVAVAYWWLPIVGSIGRQLRACEETCCDTAVVARLPHARRDYAQLLLDVVDFADPLPVRSLPQATAMSAVSNLEQRLLVILDAPLVRRRTWPAGALAVGLACAVLPCGVHYDFSARPAQVAISAEQESANGTTSSPKHFSKVELASFGCPSRTAHP